MEIEFYNKLNISKENNFEYHMNYLNEKIVSFTIHSYLKKIVGDKYQSVFMSIKDFKSLLTIKLYSEEFKLSEGQLDKIIDFLNKLDNINNNYKNINISDYYNKNIKCDVSNINDVFKDIMKNNINSVCDGYCKIYYNVDKFIKTENFEDKNLKTELELFRDQYYNLMKQILKDKTDEYIAEESLNLEKNNEYDDFRKKIFLDKLERDLTGIEKKYSGIVYLLDIIRIKLCNISPVNKKYDYMKEEIDNMIDINFIKQKINNDVFDKNELLNILKFVIEKIKSYQSESEDKELDLWVEKMMTENVNILNNENINKILPKIMEEILNKLEIVEKKIVNYRQKIYENIKEV